MKITAFLVGAALDVFGCSVASGHIIRKITGLIDVTGHCLKYETPLSGVRGRCAGNVMNEQFNDGMESFGYIIRGRTEQDAIIISFMGNGHQEVHMGVDHVTFPVDSVFVTSKNIATSLAAVGTCSYGNPYSAPAPINCEAKTNQGEFKVRFETDGKPPKRFK